MIYKFDEVVQANIKNVGKLQKFIKQKENKLKEGETVFNFKPDPLPTVHQFANSAIIRFNTIK